jgi:hypothetical protein
VKVTRPLPLIRRLHKNSHAQWSIWILPSAE